MTRLYTFLPTSRYIVEFRCILQAYARSGRPAIVFAEPHLKAESGEETPRVHLYSYWFHGDQFTARLMVSPDRKDDVDEVLSACGTIIEVPSGNTGVIDEGTTK